tara:strand:+ start:2136 stop:2462 length:327 start_codon:yes stop_codon:yes gene_type:complete
MKNTILLDNLCQSFNPNDKRIYNVGSHLSQSIYQIKQDANRKENRGYLHCLVIESIDKEEPLVALEIKRDSVGRFKAIHNSNRYNLRELKRLYDYGGSGVKIYFRKGY